MGEAEAAYRALLARYPSYDPAYHGLALLALQVGKPEVAVELITSAITLRSTVAVYFRDRGELRRRLGRRDEAVADGQAATRLAPEDPEGYYNLGLALAERQDFAAAAQSYRRAIELAPRHVRAMNNLGAALEHLDDPDGAATAYRSALEIEPGHLEAHINLGALSSWLGDLEKARASYQQAVSLKPESIAAHFGLSSLMRYVPTDPEAAMLERLATQRDRLSTDERTQLLFALGKMRDDCGQQEAAFTAWAEGNRLKAATLRYDESRIDAQTAAIIAHFDQALLARREYTGIPDPTPVFIVGMPRSGTTLCEQILASHPLVHGAGELRDLHRVVGEVMRQTPGASFPQFVATAGPATFAMIGQLYLESIRPLAPTAARIVDKMPGNYNYLGLIRLALPQARVIHMVRDPMDTCLSCYTRLFRDTMDFAYDLGTLGRHYVRYAQQMTHWRSVLPPDMILDLHYEALVDDLEGQARRMLEHLGLPWDDACLSFHETRRPVRTASLAQVRQPIYRSSIAGWRRFERQLAPLLEIVDAHRPTRDGQAQTGVQ